MGNVEPRSLVPLRSAAPHSCPRLHHLCQHFFWGSWMDPSPFVLPLVPGAGEITDVPQQLRTLYSEHDGCPSQKSGEGEGHLGLERRTGWIELFRSKYLWRRAGVNDRSSLSTEGPPSVLPAGEGGFALLWGPSLSSVTFSICRDDSGGLLNFASMALVLTRTG